MKYGIRFDGFSEFKKGVKPDLTNVKTRRLCLLDWIARHKFSTRIVLQKLLRFKTPNAFSRYLNEQVRLGYIKKHASGQVVGRQVIMLRAKGIEYLQQYIDEPIYYSTDFSKLSFQQINHDVLIQIMVLKLAYAGKITDYESEVEFRNNYNARIQDPDSEEKRVATKFPDGIVTLKSGNRAAIEVETTPKKHQRYLNIFRSHGRMLSAGKYDIVMYFSPNHTIANLLSKQIKYRDDKSCFKVEIVKAIYETVYGIKDAQVIL
jgi:hypothetical protein